ncbi:lysylphosphatidylglycerol synthase domain-containing protein [Spirillospora sp. NPDC029432]|uniref:lysylphosphatidylglycerol synthase domain-containing protein n=1 Tax=Spirillospora sp. NPDC029432 TaxID=3154599 RepID=UPI0034569F9B
METIAAGAERAAPAGPPAPGAAAAAPDPAPDHLHSEDPRPGPATRGRTAAAFRRHRVTRWTALALLPVAAVTTLLVIYGDAPVRSAATAFQNVRWEFLPALAVLSVLHYVLAAIALRGASGHPLPLYETTLTQFTAAAANRVTPSGLGAVAVNTRYLVCRGMPLRRAAVAVAALQVAGAPADLILLAIVLLIAQDSRMLETVADHAARAIAFLPPAPALIGAALLPATVLLIRRALRSPAVGRALSGMTDLCRRPGDLALTLTASAATTLVLGLALALSVLAVPGTASTADILPLLAAYLVGAAAGAALPAPGGVGSTEAALVAALAAVGITAGTALQAVLLFRAVTFWAPVPVGLLTWRTLRHRVTPEPAPPAAPGTPR